MSLEALLAILGMAAVTYAIRAGGLLLANRLPSTGFVSAWLRHSVAQPTGILPLAKIATAGRCTRNGDGRHPTLR